MIANAIAGTGNIALAGGASCWATGTGENGILILETSADNDTIVFNSNTAQNTYRPSFQQLTLDFSQEPYLIVSNILVNLVDYTPAGGTVEFAVSGSADVTVMADTALDGRTVYVRATGEEVRTASEAFAVLGSIISGEATVTVTVQAGVSMITTWIDP